MSGGQNEFYVKVMGDIQGPMSNTQVKQLATTGRLFPDSHVKRGANGNWMTADRIQGITFNNKPYTAVSEHTGSTLNTGPSKRGVAENNSKNNTKLNSNNVPSLHEKQRNAYVGVGVGLLLQMVAFFVLGETFVGLLLFLFSCPLFVWGCINYSQVKGHSVWFGLYGLLGVIGLLILIALPDEHEDAKLESTPKELLHKENKNSDQPPKSQTLAGAFLLCLGAYTVAFSAGVSLNAVKNGEGDGSMPSLGFGLTLIAIGIPALVGGFALCREWLLKNNDSDPVSSLELCSVLIFDPIPLVVGIIYLFQRRLRGARLLLTHALLLFFKLAVAAIAWNPNL